MSAAAEAARTRQASRDQRVCERGRDRDDRGLAGAGRGNVGSIEQNHVDRRRVGESRHPVVAKRRVRDPALVEVDGFKQGGPEPHHGRALDLAADVVRVDDRPALIRGHDPEDLRLRSRFQPDTDACHEYPNMHIFDWASVVQDSWFIDDGIHYNTPGYAARARLIAQALARAFPKTGHSSGCFIR
jgi:lysophospholipase L1-like esterase